MGSPPLVSPTSSSSTAWTGTISTSPTRGARSTRTSTAALSTVSASLSSFNNCFSCSSTPSEHHQTHTQPRPSSASPCSPSSVFSSQRRCSSMHLRVFLQSNTQSTVLHSAELVQTTLPCSHQQLQCQHLQDKTSETESLSRTLSATPVNLKL